MSAPIAKSQLTFELPDLSYVDIHQEEPAPRVLHDEVRPHGIHAWIEAFRGWREKRVAMAELAMMSDRELADIGLNRGDLDRVFNDNFNQDLRYRDVA